MGVSRVFQGCSQGYPYICCDGGNLLPPSQGTHWWGRGGKGMMGGIGIKPELIKMYELKMNIFELRVKVPKERKCGDWSPNNLLKVLKS